MTSTPAAVTSIAVVSIPVSDQDRAKAFYAGVLGFDVVSDQDMAPGQRWVQLRPKDAATSITLVTWFPSMPAGCLRGTVLEVENVHTARDAVLAAGGQPGEIEEQPWATFFQISDPDGNGLIVQTPSWKGSPQPS